MCLKRIRKMYRSIFAGRFSQMHVSISKESRVRGKEKKKKTKKDERRFGRIKEKVHNV